MKTIPLIGCDFVDASEVRRTNFQLCRKTKTGLEAIAIVDFNDNLVTRCAKISQVTASNKALVRLANRYKARSVPQRFIH